MAVAGIEKVLPSLKDLQLFLPLLATSGTGQQLTSYNSIIRGPRWNNEPDGPEKMYVILLDNGRSSIYAEDRLRLSLSCIRCGACLNACPVYRLVGGHAYNTAYPGPIGAVLTPHLRGFAGWQHMSSASSLCGACSAVCPVAIDLHRLLLENRWQAHQRGTASLFWRLGFTGWAAVYRRRWVLRLVPPLVRLSLTLAGRLAPRCMRGRIPPAPKQSFTELWQDYEGKRKNS